MSQFFNPTFQRQYENWIESNLNPDEIQRGTGKRYKPLKYPKFDNTNFVPYIELSEDQDNERQDSYLRSHGL